MTACNEVADIKPDISVLCRDTSSTDSDYLNIKREDECDYTPMTSSQQFDVQSSVSQLQVDEEQFDVKLHVSDEELQQPSATDYFTGNKVCIVLL